MAGRKVIDQRGFDWITFAIYISLITIGAISLYSVLYDKEAPYAFLDFHSSTGKYFIIIIVSIIFFFMSYVIDWQFWSTFAFPVYAFSILLLVAVLLFGSDIKGARSWFNIFGFSFQPSEFAKFGTALAISSYLSHHKNDFRTLKSILQTSLIVIIPMLLILMQPDAGSAIIFLSVLILYYRAGFTVLFYVISGLFAATFIFTLIYNPQLVSFGAIIFAIIVYTLFFSNKKYWNIAAVIISLAGIYFYYKGFKSYTIATMSLIVLVTTFLHWLKNRENSVALVPITALTIVFLSFVTNYSFNHILKPHQQDRLNVWLNPEKCDPRGSLYNVLQSKIAIGSGGIGGKGFLKGAMTQLNFVPEQTTDFIFSSIGEEQGFIGVVSIIVLFLLLLLRLVKIAERGKNNFITYFAYTLAGYIFIHFFMNIGMNMGLLPVVGIPLPFISKGGSSLIIFSIMMGVVLKMDAERNVR